MISAPTAEISGVTAEVTTTARLVDPVGQPAGGGGAAASVSGHVSAPSDWRPRPKESDQVFFLPHYPTAANLRAWKTEVYARAQAASARSDHHTTTWLKKAEDELISVEELGSVPRELFTLDAKLQAALLAIYKGDFGETLVQLNADSYRGHDRPLTPTHILRHAFIDCKTTGPL